MWPLEVRIEMDQTGTQSGAGFAMSDDEQQPRQTEQRPQRRIQARLKGGFATSEYTAALCWSGTAI